MYRPLADEIRPASLDEVVGQNHILGKNGLLRRLILSGNIPNLIFYGPSGTGKTTVASIISDMTNRKLYKLNATTAGISDIREIIKDLDTFMTPNGALLYLDEIQYFNKKQQQSLLEFIENGKITLIASTTENPYFCVFNAILSRSTVFEFKTVSASDMLPAIERAVSIMERRTGLTAIPDEKVYKHIAQACGGDVRKAINAVELLFSVSEKKDGNIMLSESDAQIASQKSAMRYDRDGDGHYDLLSAFQKSIRGSDPDAALHYLARLLEAGDILSACRRLLVTAAEDIGLAYPQAIPIVKACVDSALQLGLPEAALPLADAVVLLATSPKSNSGAEGIGAALADVRSGKIGDIPRHLMNVHADGADVKGIAKYKYAHDFPNHYVPQQYLPDELKDTRYYKYGENKAEQAAKAYWDQIKGER